MFLTAFVEAGIKKELPFTAHIAKDCSNCLRRAQLVGLVFLNRGSTAPPEGVGEPWDWRGALLTCHWEALVHFIF